jgi:hypothetical protein
MRVEKPFPVPLPTLEERFTFNRYVIICKDNVWIKKGDSSTAILWNS